MNLFVPKVGQHAVLFIYFFSQENVTEGYKNTGGGTVPIDEMEQPPMEGQFAIFDFYLSLSEKQVSRKCKCISKSDAT